MASKSQKMNCFALLFLYYYDYLTLFFSFHFVEEKPLFFRKQLQIFSFRFCVLKAGLCRFFVHFACLFIVVIYILIVLWIAKLHPEKKKKFFLKYSTRKHFVLWMAICMLGGEKKRKYNNHHWKHLGRKFEWIHESFKFLMAYFVEN